MPSQDKRNELVSTGMFKNLTPFVKILVVDINNGTPAQSPFSSSLPPVNPQVEVVPVSVHLALSSSTPRMKYEVIENICRAIYNILVDNLNSVDAVLHSGIISSLIQVVLVGVTFPKSLKQIKTEFVTPTVSRVIPTTVSNPQERRMIPTLHSLGNTFKWIFISFINVCYAVKQMDDLMNFGVMSTIAAALKTHVNLINCISAPPSSGPSPSPSRVSPSMVLRYAGLDDIVIMKVANLCYLIARNGCAKLPHTNFPNVYRMNFQKDNILELMLNSYKYCRIQQGKGLVHKKSSTEDVCEATAKFFSLAIALILRNERPSIAYGPILEYVCELRTIGMIAERSRRTNNTGSTNASSPVFSPSFNAKNSASSDTSSSKTVLRMVSASYSSKASSAEDVVGFTNMEGNYYNIATEAWKGMIGADEVYREYAARHKEELK
jgi:hypothetical protein